MVYVIGGIKGKIAISSWCKY